MYYNIASTAGYLIGSLVTDGIPLRVAFIFWEVGVTMNVIGRAVVFWRNRQTLSLIEDEVACVQDVDELTRLRNENLQLKAQLADLKK